VTPCSIERVRSTEARVRSADLLARRCAVRPWKDPIMAAKPKPQPSDEAREQLRRALQTSMDTRQ
jgi:hypothetical protein